MKDLTLSTLVRTEMFAKDARAYVRHLAKKLGKDEAGTSLIEYSILVGLIVGGTVATITVVGSWVSGRWALLQTAVEGTPKGP